MADAKIIALELQAIAGALTVSNNALTKVSGQYPPGPPEDGWITSLNSIIASAKAISGTATAILNAGGTTPPNG